MKRDENIPYPTKEEMQRDIQHIVHSALPKQRTFWRELHRLTKQLGWRYLLPNQNEWLFTVLMVVLLSMLVGFTFSAASSISPVKAMLFFTLSPLLFISVSLFSLYEKRAAHTFELEMTTKFTMFQMLAVRMLVFSSVAIVWNMSVSWWLASMHEWSFFRLWLLSLTSLFIFATGLLMSLRTGVIFRKVMRYLLGWLIVNGSFLSLADAAYVEMLLSLPIIIYTVIVSLCTALFGWALQRMYLRKQEGVLHC